MTSAFAVHVRHALSGNRFLNFWGIPNGPFVALRLTAAAVDCQIHW